jgi:uncharacterized protein (DUF3084 family)
MNLTTVAGILQLLAIIAGLIVAAATVVAFFRANLARAQIEGLRGDRDDLIDRNERLTKTLAELKESNAVRDATISEQVHKIHILEKVVTGREQLNHLQKQLDAHDKRVDERHITLVKMMGEVVESNRLLKESNDALVDSNSYIQAALIDFLKYQEGKKDEQQSRT